MILSLTKAHSYPMPRKLPLRNTIQEIIRPTISAPVVSRAIPAIEQRAGPRLIILTPRVKLPFRTTNSLYPPCASTMAPQTTGATASVTAITSTAGPGMNAAGGGATAGGAGAAAASTSASTSSQSEAIDAASAHNEQTRQDLELKLQELIECLLELSITVYDFQAESNTLVHQKIQELISQLTDIEGFKDKLDMMVPWEVLSYIEDGKNPDLFSKSFVEAVAGENQFTNGKITALKSFEAALTQNLGSTFPDEMRGYQHILEELGGSGTASLGAPSKGVSSKDESTALEEHRLLQQLQQHDGSSNSGTANNTASSSSSGSASVSPTS